MKVARNEIMPWRFPYRPVRRAPAAITPRQEHGLPHRVVAGCPPRGFTLVELLVVITIIGILASLVTVAAVAALKAARRGAIIAEINQISTGVEDYKNKVGSYPPNAVVDGSGPLDETTIFNDLKRHLKQAYPRHREPDALLAKIAGQFTGSGSQNLAGGMSASEALVFWLSGASADPKYPISGEGGIAYPAADGTNDPIESRNWVYPFAVERLGPRDADNFFNGRFIEYTHPDPAKNGQILRINFWEYLPSGSEHSYVYFDASRNQPTAAFDPPASSALSPNPLHVHAIKQISSTPGTGPPIAYANVGKFQILHCGLDEEWGEEQFEEMSVHGVDEAGGNINDPTSYLLFPDGPFVGDIADTLTNFTEGTLEDSQP